jgi:hypothetical protein
MYNSTLLRMGQASQSVTGAEIIPRLRKIGGIIPARGDDVDYIRRSGRHPFILNLFR